MSGRRFSLRPIGRIRSVLKQRGEAPLQGSEGAPDAWLEVEPAVLDGLEGLKAGDEILVITWLHRGKRNVLGLPARRQTAWALRCLRDAIA